MQFRLGFTFQILILLLLSSGCQMMPVTRLKPVLKNPYPQYTNIVVVPFVNKTDNPKVDGSFFAQSYAAELQLIPGFDVVPVRAVEEKMQEYGLTKINGPEDLRYLGRLLGADVVVIGRVNNYEPYYPQKLGLTVEWYAVNQYFQPIPVGHGLPWGTTQEENIPYRIVSAAEFDLARSQLATQTPDDPEGEEAFKAFVLSREKEKQRQLEAAQQPVQLPPPPPNSLDPDDPDYEEYDPQAEMYKILQQKNVDQQLSYAFGGRTAIPQGKQNVRITTQNAEAIKRKWLEELKEENNEDFNLPLTSPIPGGTKSSDWTDKSHSNETLKGFTPKTDKSQTGSGNTYRGQNYNPQFPPNQTANSVGGNSIFIALSPEGMPMAAYRIDPQTGMVTSEVPLSELGLGPSQLQTTVPPVPNYYATMPGMMQPNGQIAPEPNRFPGLPDNWPDPRGLIPNGPVEKKPQGTVPSNAPVMSLTKQYMANDSELTQALEDYNFHFRDDRRSGNWQMLLLDADSFVSFCCRMHIWEMLGSRGGADKAIQVKRTWKMWNGGIRPY
ncbi:MAG: hypothetical protein ACRC2T_17465 [Thermoguttaceae bacterium]